MNKFIRTKDGIFDTNKLNLNKIIGNIKYEIIDNVLFETMYGYEPHLYKYKIINQADTIEELCDRFVVVCDNEAMVINRHLTIKEIIKSLNYYEEQDNMKIYGAIWVENKGLIYVAKLNDKGDLELI